MLISIIIIMIAFLWLGYETKWFTIQLLTDKQNYATYTVYNSLKSGRSNKGTVLYSGGNLPKRDDSITNSNYEVFLSPGIDNVLCGFDWLDKHCASMVDYKPTVYLAIAGVRYNMTIKEPSIIKDIMKANKLTRTERKELKLVKATN